MNTNLEVFPAVELGPDVQFWISSQKADACEAMEELTENELVVYPGPIPHPYVEADKRRKENGNEEDAVHIQEPIPGYSSSDFRLKGYEGISR